MCAYFRASVFDMLEQKRKVSPLMCVTSLQLACGYVMHVGRRKASESIENVDLTIKCAAHPHDDVRWAEGKCRAAGWMVGGMGAAKVGKGVRRMPWLWKAMKDAASCDKPW